MLLRAIFSKLTEPLHQSFRILWAEAFPGIYDLETQKCLGVLVICNCIAMHATGDMDFTLRGELDRVSEKVDEDLANSESISDHHRWYVCAHEIVDLEALINRSGGDGVNHILYHGPDVEPRFDHRH